jgi:hypothetical protein
MRTPSEAKRRKGFESSGSVSDQSNQASMRANLAWPECNEGNPSRSAILRFRDGSYEWQAIVKATQSEECPS